MSTEKTQQKKVLNLHAAKLKKINAEKKQARVELRKKEEKKPEKKEKKPMAPVTREVTLHLQRWMHRVTFKKRAPLAMKVIREEAQKMMKTQEVKLDTGLNQYIWHQGIRSVPHRIRVRLARMEKEGQDGQFYTLVSYVPVASFKGLVPQLVEEEAD